MTRKVEQSSIGTETNTPESLSGAEAILRCLLAEGVDTIFGYPGGAIMPVYDALWHYTDRLQHILPRHEQGAIHAAQGYAGFHAPGLYYRASLQTPAGNGRLPGNGRYQLHHAGD